MERIVSPSGGNYQLGDKLGGTDVFNLYECILSDKRVAILKIARALEHNGVLDREAYILDVLRKEAEETEKEFAAVKGDTNVKLNYQFCFPNLVESFIYKEQDNRRVNIVCMSEIANKLGELVPLSNLMTKKSLRIDPRTSAWVLGKLLKMLDFAHNLNISVGNLESDNILIHPKNHYISIFDWSAAIMENELDVKTIHEEIRKVTLAVIEAMGGDVDTMKFPEDEQLADGKYVALLGDLINEQFATAKEAHTKFYECIWSIWPREYYPFTTCRI